MLVPFKINHCKNKPDQRTQNNFDRDRLWETNKQQTRLLHKLYKNYHRFAQCHYRSCLKSILIPHTENTSLLPA